MICLPCKTAGRFIEMQADPPKIEALHTQCRGGTWCDCQHVTETVLKGGTS